MNRPEQNDWLEAGLRRRPTAEEERRWETYCAEHPQERPTVEEELRLNQLLRQLPDAPLSTNFTDRVLQRVDGLPARRPFALRLPPVSEWSGHLGWARIAAVAALALTLGTLGYQRYRIHTRQELARSVVTLTPVARVPTLEMLENFEAIRRLSQAPPVQDRDLVMASQ